MRRGPGKRSAVPAAQRLGLDAQHRGSRIRADHAHGQSCRRCAGFLGPRVSSARWSPPALKGPGAIADFKKRGRPVYARPAPIHPWQGWSRSAFRRKHYECGVGAAGPDPRTSGCPIHPLTQDKVFDVPSPRAAWTMVVARLSIPAASASAGTRTDDGRLTSRSRRGRGPSRRDARRRRSACGRRRAGRAPCSRDEVGAVTMRPVTARADAVLRLVIRLRSGREGDERLALCETGKNLKVRAGAHAVAVRRSGTESTKAVRGRPAEPHGARSVRSILPGHRRAYRST